MLCAALCWLADLAATPFVLLRRSVRVVDGARPSADATSVRDASVIVLNYDGRDYLAALLPGLKTAIDRAAGDHEVIVVDNGSVDGSAEFVAENFPWVRLVRLPENRFFIRGNAAGVQAATKDVLVFLNNDMEVEPDFLANLLARFGPSDLFAVTARIEMTGNQVETGLTRASFRRGALHQVQVASAGAALIPALWAGGGSSAFDRRKFGEIGGFESLYEPCYAEDLSLSYQAWRRGYRIVYADDSVVHHRHRGTSERVFGAREVEVLDRRNRELFFWRSVTDPRMMIAKVVWSWWNLRKDARRTGYRVQLAALLRTLPRLPRAIAAREFGRAFVRRSDRETLLVACSVSAHRRLVEPRVVDVPRVLSIGTTTDTPPAVSGVSWQAVTLEIDAIGGRPHDDVFGRVPARFHDAARPGVIRDRARDLVRERDYDCLHFRDPFALAATIEEIPPGELCCVSFEAFRPERGEGAYLRRLLDRIAFAICANDGDAEVARGLGAKPVRLEELQPGAFTPTHR